MSFTYNAPTSVAGVIVPPLTVDLSWIAAAPIGGSTGPSLLLHMDGTNGSTSFLDSSGWGVSVTASGAASISTTAPEFGTGRGAFGVGDSISFPSASGSNLDLMTSDFTIEGWLKTTSIFAPQIFFSNSGPSPFVTGFRLLVTPVTGVTANFQFQPFGGGGIVSATVTALDGNYHSWACVRSGSTLMLFWDGVLSNTTTIGAGSLGTQFSTTRIGGDALSAGQSTWFLGSLDEFRITQAALYAGNYTPTGPFPNPSSNVSLLLHMDGTIGSTSFPDASLNNLTVTALGAAAVETSNVKFGSGAVALNGTNAALSIPLIVGGPLDLSTSQSDWTAEWWVYHNTNVGFYCYLDAHGVVPTGGTGWRVSMSSGSLTFEPSTSWGSSPGSAIITTGVWHHVAVVRSGLILLMFLDGVQTAPGAVSASQVQSPGTFFISGTVSSSGFVDGFMDEVRITKGLARYTSNFTPPTAPFPVPTPASPPPGYDVYRNGVSIGSFLGGPSLVDTVPSVGTYLYTVAAWDGSADISAQSSPLSVTFLAAPPTVVIATKFVPSLNFKAIMTANPGSINPRVYPPEVDSTARIIPRVIV